MINKKDITLFVPNTILKNQFSNYALATFCALQSLTVPTMEDIHCVTVPQITYHLTHNIEHLKARSRMLDYIKCGINELIENNIIEKLDEQQKHLILNCAALWIDTEFCNFTIIQMSEVRLIFSQDKVNGFLLLRYFLSLVGTISSKITVYLPNGESKNRVVGNFTIEHLAEITGISKRSIIEYNKVLEELGLIYIYRYENFVIVENSTIKSIANIYGRKCDEKYIKTFAQNQQHNEELHKYAKKCDTSNSNDKRKLAQMYNQLARGLGKNYTENDIQNIYTYVIAENKKYENLYKKTNAQSYLDKVRDVSIFSKFEFLKRD